MRRVAKAPVKQSALTRPIEIESLQGSIANIREQIEGGQIEGGNWTGFIREYMKEWGNTKQVDLHPVKKEKELSDSIYHFLTNVNQYIDEQDELDSAKMIAITNLLNANDQFENNFHQVAVFNDNPQSLDLYYEIIKKLLANASQEDRTKILETCLTNVYGFKGFDYNIERNMKDQKKNKYYLHYPYEFYYNLKIFTELQQNKQFAITESLSLFNKNIADVAEKNKDKFVENIQGDVKNNLEWVDYVLNKYSETKTIIPSYTRSHTNEITESLLSFTYPVYQENTKGKIKSWIRSFFLNQLTGNKKPYFWPECIILTPNYAYSSPESTNYHQSLYQYAGEQLAQQKRLLKPNNNKMQEIFALLSQVTWRDTKGIATLVKKYLPGIELNAIQPAAVDVVANVKKDEIDTAIEKVLKFPLTKRDKHQIANIIDKLWNKESHLSTAERIDCLSSQIESGPHALYTLGMLLAESQDIALLKTYQVLLTDIRNQCIESPELMTAFERMHTVPTARGITFTSLLSKLDPKNSEHVETIYNYLCSGLIPKEQYANFSSFITPLREHILNLTNESAEMNLNDKIALLHSITNPPSNTWGTFFHPTSAITSKLGKLSIFEHPLQRFNLQLRRLQDLQAAPAQAITDDSAYKTSSKAQVHFPPLPPPAFNPEYTPGDPDDDGFYHIETDPTPGAPIAPAADPETDMTEDMEFLTDRIELLKMQLESAQVKYPKRIPDIQGEIAKFQEQQQAIADQQQKKPGHRK